MQWWPDNNGRRILALLYDGLAAAAGFHLALYLRLGSGYVHYAGGYLAFGTALLALLMVLVSMRLRLYQRLWQYASLQDMVVITKTASAVLVVFYLTMFVTIRLEAIPRSVPFIHWMVLLGLMGGARFAYRMFAEKTLSLSMKDTARKIPVLLVDAGDDAELFIRESLRNPAHPYRVVGLIDDRNDRKGRNLHGIRIWGDSQHIPETVKKLEIRDEKPERIILADRHIGGEEVRRLFAIADGLGISLARLPRLSDIHSGMGDRLQVTPIAVEDLLGRPQNTHDRQQMQKFIAGKAVMITGAGGSIGAELARQAAAFSPKKLILIEQSEYNLYQIDQELRETYPDLALANFLADVRDAGRMRQLIGETAPDSIFHAAAIKHVPLAEENPEETILTNIFGTRNVADAALVHGVQTLVLISTDKAVNPTNIMGATKRAAETYLQALGQQHDSGTRCITVRFGNVLGSTGSVVPLFQKQLARGGPLTITHPDMVRYFMTTREAVELVIAAAAMGTETTEKNGMIYVLDMGKPVRIVDLARQMIRLAGLRPDAVPITYTGLRAGEKLYEELFHSGENAVKTAHDGILLAASRVAQLSELEGMFTALRHAAEKRDQAQAVALLNTIVPEYTTHDTPHDDKHRPALRIG